jgi:hypothetical protein
MQRAQLRADSYAASEETALIAKLNDSCLPETTLIYVHAGLPRRDRDRGGQETGRRACIHVGVR